jgi:hypothetical protein
MQLKADWRDRTTEDLEPFHSVFSPLPQTVVRLLTPRQANDSRSRIECFANVFLTQYGSLVYVLNVGASSNVVGFTLRPGGQSGKSQNPFYDEQPGRLLKDIFGGEYRISAFFLAQPKQDDRMRRLGSFDKSR